MGVCVEKGMDFNKYFDNYSGDKSKLTYLVDKVKVAVKTYETVFTDFLTPEEAAVLGKICQGNFLKVEFLGGREECERVMGALFKEERYGDFPIEVLKISGNFKFESLNHRDYLGTILSLGVKREKFGDINVFEDGAEIYIHSDICSYIGLNINKIKHTGVKTSVISIAEAREKIQKYNDFKVNVASLRLDSITAALLNLSRTSAVNLIKAGEVKLNFSINYNLNTKIKINDLISVKGYGRFKIDDILGFTKSDRLTLLAKKFL